MKIIFAIIIGYFLGSIPFGYIAGKIANVDITKQGSGNIGFTNVWRVLGIRYGIFVLFFDILKGYLGASIGYSLAGEYGALFGGIVCILGHTFSVFLHFRGGKGVASGAGVLLFMCPKALLVCALCLTIVVGITKYMSLGSILSMILCPIFMIIFHAPVVYICGILPCCIYIIWKHKSNIQRLLNGTENKIGKSNKTV